MATYTRLGTFILGGDLTTDPVGKVHRGLTITGSRFDRHKLLRTFADELVDAGIAARMEEAGRVASQLAGTRGFGSAYQFLGGKTPHVACDYVGGRSLAQLIQKAHQEQIPLGVDHALSVLQGLSQSLMVLHGKGFTHGSLSPHSVWVSFEGATHILDAPFGPAIQALLPKCPTLSRALEAYRPSQGATAQQQDFYALGAMLYELLTLESLPSKAQIPQTLASATLKAAQEDAPVPPELQGLLRRLLMVDAPFESAGAFSAELERVLYDGDYSPTTFNMAFFMHTLFREENEADTVAMKADTVADFTPLMDAIAGARSIEGLDSGKYIRWAVIGGGVLVILLGALFYTNWSKNKENAAVIAKMEALQKEMDLLKMKAEEAAKKEQVALTGLAKVEQDFKDRKITRAEYEKQKTALTQAVEKAREDKQAAAKQQEVVAQNVETLRPPTAVAPKQATVAAITPAPATGPVAPPPGLTTPPQTATPPATQPAATPTPAPVVTTPAPAVAPPPVAAPVPQPTAQPNVPDTPVEILSRSSAAEHLSPRARAMMKNFKGRTFSIKIKVFVDANGRAQRAVVEQGSGTDFGLEDAAISAAMASSFKPATQNGRNVSGWISVPYAMKM